MLNIHVVCAVLVSICAVLVSIVVLPITWVVENLEEHVDVTKVWSRTVAACGVLVGQASY